LIPLLICFQLISYQRCWLANSEEPEFEDDFVILFFPQHIFFVIVQDAPTPSNFAVVTMTSLCLVAGAKVSDLSAITSLTL
jgi:hypothetical protein